jgi:hypothetical protein
MPVELAAFAVYTEGSNQLERGLGRKQHVGFQ